MHTWRSQSAEQRAQSHLNDLCAAVNEHSQLDRRSIAVTIKYWVEGKWYGNAMTRLLETCECEERSWKQYLESSMLQFSLPCKQTYFFQRVSLSLFKTVSDVFFATGQLLPLISFPELSPSLPVLVENIETLKNTFIFHTLSFSWKQYFKSAFWVLVSYSFLPKMPTHFFFISPSYFGFYSEALVLH